MKLNELWNQLHSDARSTYRLYSREIDAKRPEDARRSRHILRVAKQFFWAILEKLSPARRVVLLVALALILIPSSTSGGDHVKGWEIRFDSSFSGALLMFGLLILELTDRVVMKRDLQIAKEIQAWLLPARPPQIPGLEIAFATRPANTVAGDYYDVFPRRGFEASTGDTSKESFLIAVADVAGKSVPAAMLMATIQASLRTLCTTPGSLTELVERMNRYACTNSQNGRRFTTAFIAEYEPTSRVLSYVNAGHNAPILRRRSGVTEELGAGGLPLGVMEDSRYESGSVTLEPGDMLAAFTDGLVEAENSRSEEYGGARFLAVLQANAAAPAEVILNSVLSDIDRFVGTAPQHDDVTLMLLKAA
ncbi:MAG: PP2C family protein-serine/threonine phosphatase [Terracidiphilus sp.]